MKENYEVKNAEIEALLKTLGHAIAAALPDGWGMTLLLFDYETPPNSSMFYISSARREDMLNAMKEFIAREEAQ